MAIATAAERRGRSDDLVTDIADALSISGEFVAQIDLLPTQQVVDFNWAAHSAGRSLGIKIQIDTRIVKETKGGHAQVRVSHKVASLVATSAINADPPRQRAGRRESAADDGGAA